ncbi:gelsolin-like [Anopheles ziemanni]|uniref:gelsolin-like n=1 Tax=Anopheles coustani TaxID=139045 RepID=UPI002658D98F|nr:gelsolin-like [Anopheles coustani]XP_058170215.1 gelsolin-like [Anopheles ziemanni]
MSRWLIISSVLSTLVAVSLATSIFIEPGSIKAAFKDAGKTVGVEVWRIENFQPVTVPKPKHGEFYNGDCYVVMNTKEGKNKVKSYDIHFWLGTKTTEDEAFTAQYFADKLGNMLNGVPVQHREVEDAESDLFFSYFKGTVRYLEGSVASGFKHVTTNDPGAKRLFQIKGTKNIRVRQMELAVSAMNKGDCFILEADREIYMYVGPTASCVEKLKAIIFANQVRDQDHTGRSKVHILDEFSTLTDQENFFTVLGSGSPSLVPDQSTASADAGIHL